jgi:hypothetical protein
METRTDKQLISSSRSLILFAMSGALTLFCVAVPPLALVTWLPASIISNIMNWNDIWTEVGVTVVLFLLLRFLVIPLIMRLSPPAR